MYDVSFKTKNQNIQALLLSTDFGNDFKSVSLNFIARTDYSYYNFGDSVKQNNNRPFSHCYLP